MIIKISHDISNENYNLLINEISNYKCNYFINKGNTYDVVILNGETANIDDKRFSAIVGVIKVARLSVPYKLASREFKEEDTIIKVNNVVFKQDFLPIIAGPCAVESREQILKIAKYIKENNSHILRGGIVKPRTSPYSFQGLEEEALEYMEEAKEKYNLALCCELMSVEQVEKYANHIDIIQIGARNMQNYDLLKAVGQTKKPVLLKRGLSATLEEFLMAAEYILVQGNPNVILCERGIRTFEDAYRNVTDINAIVMLKELTHLPVIADPSHSTGIYWMVEKVALATTIAGADGLIVETHYKPSIALSDGQQSLNPENFKQLCNKINKLKEFIKIESINK
ncbi:MAG: 3-deoxy-7-phosphoheptulonate synthase [Erysipelotrichales bacterium]